MAKKRFMYTVLRWTTPRSAVNTEKSNEQNEGNERNERVLIGECNEQQALTPR